MRDRHDFGEERKKKERPRPIREGRRDTSLRIKHEKLKQDTRTVNEGERHKKKMTKKKNAA